MEPRVITDGEGEQGKEGEEGEKCVGEEGGVCVCVCERVEREGGGGWEGLLGVTPHFVDPGNEGTILVGPHIHKITCRDHNTIT